MDIKIEIDNCSQCPFFKSNRVYTADSFEMVYRWQCDHKNMDKPKTISGYVERNNPEIPKWCPTKL